MLKPWISWLTLGAVALSFGGCARVPSPAQRLFHLEQQAAGNDWQRFDMEAPPFVLAVWRPRQPAQSGAVADKTLTVYIEGDGLAWVTRVQPSKDPTPVEPIGFNLALRHPDRAVAYLARPCQYTMPEKSAGCETKYWTSHRFAPEVVAATSRVLSDLKAVAGASSLRLIGYSGGGALTALVAAGRSDVQALMTIAGNLDHALWTESHAVAPLSGSLNPVGMAFVIASLPQLHFVGTEDAVMPRAVAESFVASQGTPNCSAIIPVNHVGHRHGWVDAWPELLAHPLPCR